MLISSNWNSIVRVAFVLALALILIVTVYFSFPKYKEARDLADKKLKIEEENKILEEKIKKLRTNRERFASDPSFVERNAREMGMVKPEETIFKFVTDDDKK